MKQILKAIVTRITQEFPEYNNGRTYILSDCVIYSSEHLYITITGDTLQVYHNSSPTQYRSKLGNPDSIAEMIDFIRKYR